MRGVHAPVWSFAYTPGLVAASPTTAAHGSKPAGSPRTADGFTTITPPKQQGLPSPKVTKTYYDNLGHPMETIDTLLNKTLVSYNERDQMVWSEDEDGNPTDYTRDLVTDDLLKVEQPDPDGSGPLGRPATRYRYDESAIGTASAPGPALTGLQAGYFRNKDLRGKPVKRQNDATVDFDWGSARPAALGTPPPDEFSVRWTGYLNVPATAAYSFATRADDGTRLVVDGVHAIENWANGAARTVASPAITLSGGWHKIVLEYYVATGSAQVHLQWCAGCAPAVPSAVVPTSALRPGWGNRTSEVNPLGTVSFRERCQSVSGKPKSRST